MYVEGKYTGEFLLSEGPGSISREEITIAANSGDMVPGTVLGKITASGKHALYGNTNTDGTEVAAGILYARAKNSTSDQKAVIFCRMCEVNAADLTGLDANARADLAALQVIVR